MQSSHLTVPISVSFDLAPILLQPAAMLLLLLQGVTRVMYYGKNERGGDPDLLLFSKIAI
jgi:hypothetical protein